MDGWKRTGPVVVEVDGSAEGLRAIDYACTEAMRVGAGLVLVAVHPARDRQAVHQPWPTPERVEEFLRIALAHVRRQVGQALRVTVVPAEGVRTKVLSVAVGIDGSALSSEAVEFAFQAAAERQGNVIAVHAATRPSSPDGSWVREGDLALTRILAKSSADHPEVQVTRYLTNRPVVAALVHKAHEVGLVVVGAHAGRLPIGDPVARRAIAAVATAVAVVAHRPDLAELHPVGSVGAESIYTYPEGTK